MENRNDSQLSLDFEAKINVHADNAISACERPRLRLVHSSNTPIQSSSEEMRGNKIIEGILSHARSLSW